MITIEHKIQDIVTTIEGKINDELATTDSNYCQLVIYRPNKKIITSKDYDCSANDKNMFIVDIASTQTVGTINCSQDDNENYWILITAAKNHKPSLQATYFKYYLNDIEDMTESGFNVEQGDNSHYLTKPIKVVSKITLVKPEKYIEYTLMMSLISTSFWVSFYFLGSSSAFLIAPVVMTFIMCISVFGDGDTYY
jgi:hypothetical protein